VKAKVLLGVVLGAICLYGVINWVPWSKSTAPNPLPEQSEPVTVFKSKLTSSVDSQPASKIRPPKTEVVTVETIANSLLEKLRDPDQGIRQQALREIIDLDDRSLNPQLLQIAARTTDLAERAKIIAAVDYINLPNPDEYFSGQGQAGSFAGSNASAEKIAPPHRKKKQPDAAAQLPVVADPQPAQ